MPFGSEYMTLESEGLASENLFCYSNITLCNGHQIYYYHYVIHNSRRKRMKTQMKMDKQL
jgi:hypothetical protein